MASNKTSGSSSNSSDNDGSGSSASSPERKNPVSSVIHIPKAVPNPKYDEEDNTLSEADGKMAKHRRDRSRSHSSDRTKNRDKLFVHEFAGPWLIAARNGNYFRPLYGHLAQAFALSFQHPWLCYVPQFGDKPK